jgi:hypothetical protein
LARTIDVKQTPIPIANNLIAFSCMTGDITTIILLYITVLTPYSHIKPNRYNESSGEIVKNVNNKQIIEIISREIEKLFFM